MSSKKNKYASIGCTVRIVTPKQFVRCGYPLSIKDVMSRDFEEIDKECVKLFSALENRPVPVVEPENSEWGFTSLMDNIPTMSATVHGMLCCAIAAYRLENEGFGGSVRSIVEADGVFEKGQLWTVVSKRFVKTGTRYSGHSYQNSYTGENEYEPGGLEDEKTHCVYTVRQFNGKYKILAQHCEIVKAGE